MHACPVSHPLPVSAGAERCDLFVKIVHAFGEPLGCYRKPAAAHVLQFRRCQNAAMAMLAAEPLACLRAALGQSVRWPVACTVIGITGLIERRVDPLALPARGLACSRQGYYIDRVHRMARHLRLAAGCQHLVQAIGGRDGLVRTMKPSKRWQRSAPMLSAYFSADQFTTGHQCASTAEEYIVETCAGRHHSEAVDL